MILELKDICKDYMQDEMVVPVLKDINLTVEEGEYVAVIGPTKASIAKSNDFYRNLIYVKADSYGILTELASNLDAFR